MKVTVVYYHWGDWTEDVRVFTDPARARTDVVDMQHQASDDKQPDAEAAIEWFSEHGTEVTITECQVIE